MVEFTNLFAGIEVNPDGCQSSLFAYAYPNIRSALNTPVDVTVKRQLRSAPFIKMARDILPPRSRLALNQLRMISITKLHLKSAHPVLNGKAKTASARSVTRVPAADIEAPSSNLWRRIFSGTAHTARCNQGIARRSLSWSQGL
jgi:hypothetical protein